MTAFDIWLYGFEKAVTLSAVLVPADTKQMKDFKNVLSLAQWLDEKLFGISNALIEDWPVVAIHNLKSRIVEFGSISQWLGRHKTHLKAEREYPGQLWDQLIGL